jgi:crotonobetainyl-CoA:carnitine CoA-transferase CaiB-like acyl-CoA transferase
VLRKLKIIDLSTVLAGPSVATFFAELGSEVIKIENKNNPDVTRSWFSKGEEAGQLSAYFASINYKKEYRKLDFLDSNDHALFLKEIVNADILISNFKKGDEEKLNLTDDFLRSVNPQLIIGKISGFSHESDRVAYDLILQAETGFMSINGTKESGPLKLPVALIDVLAAHQLKEGLLLALLDLKENGTARTVEVSLYDTAICSLMNQASNYLMTGILPERMGSLHPNIAPYGELFQTLDQKTITFAIGSNLHFFKLCLFLNLNSLPTDVRYADNKSRVINRSSLYDYLSDQVCLKTAEEISTAMRHEKVPYGIVKNLAEVLNSDVANDMVKSEIIDTTLSKRMPQIAFKWK